MNWLILLDVLLFVAGLLALSLRLFDWVRRTVAIFAFYLGFALIATAGVDVGLAEWEKANRPQSSELKAAYDKRIRAHRSSEAFAQKPKGSVEAPDFCLPALDEVHPIRLSDFRGRKPVVLIFGSFGWNVFCEYVVHVPELHEKYGDLAQFLFVYISEAPHELPMALRPFAEPPGAPAESRTQLLPRARAGMKLYNLRFPCLIDNEKNEVETLYNAYPTRLIIVDTAGRIALESSFSPWEDITGWLDRYGASHAPQPSKQD